ncbi:hypothetical protein D0Z67_11615 [Streptomyces seoulensis]|uniref:DUF4034 domain-containing protein n=1 Tax=Streptomyces seoulensis TaxID=73044 RepID=A0A4P6TVL6_STRSO|nr:hypothetical protein [Streptomyces seoulensis]QBJ90887.1 hypothetical protein D0Z67_11615 [Streptomyces seoulensis]
MSLASPLPPPDFEITSAYPEVAWLRQAVAAWDWAGVRQHLAGLPQGSDTSQVFGTVAGTEGVERALRDLVAAAPDDVFALTLLGAREIAIGWEIRTAARAESVTREQFATFHAHLRTAEQLLIRATALDPSYVPAWAERLNTARGLGLGQNEARRRYDRLAKSHPHHFTAQTRLLQQLCPKWGGSWEAAHSFARDRMLGAPDGSLSAGLVAEAHLEHWLDLDAGEERHAYLRQSHVHAELVEAAGRSVLHPEFRRDPGWVTVAGCFAALFSLIGDTARAAAHFRALGNLASKLPWSYLGDPAEAYVRHRDAALAPASPTFPPAAHRAEPRP